LQEGLIKRALLDGFHLLIVTTVDNHWITFQEVAAELLEFEGGTLFFFAQIFVTEVGHHIRKGLDFVIFKQISLLLIPLIKSRGITCGNRFGLPVVFVVKLSLFLVKVFGGLDVRVILLLVVVLAVLVVTILQTSIVCTLRGESLQKAERNRFLD